MLELVALRPADRYPHKPANYPLLGQLSSTAACSSAKPECKSALRTKSCSQSAAPAFVRAALAILADSTATGLWKSSDPGSPAHRSASAQTQYSASIAAETPAPPDARHRNAP